MHWKMIDPGDLNIKQAIRNLVAVLFAAIFLLVGCQGQSILDAIFPQAGSELGSNQPTPTLDQTTEIKATSTPESPLFYHLELWVPPQFDPNGDSESSKLLNQRIRDYLLQNPQVNLDVRVKAQTGPGGMLDSLNGTSAVAQDALPSLVLLSHSDLVTAADRKLLFPIEGISSSVDQNDWFPFAQDLAIYQGLAYGLPFASNALGLLYKGDSLTSSQPSWNDVFKRLNSLIFAGGDTDALVTLALYQSAGGTLEPQMGQLAVDSNALTSVLNIYNLGRRTGVIRSDVLDYQTEDQAWEAFNNSSAKGAIVWANRLFSSEKNLQLALLPPVGETSVTLATGLTWCLTESDEQKQAYAVALADYLSAPEFLAQWAPVSGYLPVRPSSLTGFSEEGLQSSLSDILSSARLRPDRQSLAEFSTQFEAAAAGVISGSMTPDEGVQSVFTQLEASGSQ